MTFLSTRVHVESFPILNDRAFAHLCHGFHGPVCCLVFNEGPISVRHRVLLYPVKSPLSIQMFLPRESGLSRSHY
jgi:hypothetical protein